jgi:nitrate/nitrite-specific signal transduction histidine kinase
MSEGSSGSDDLVAKQKEFLEAFFKKGAEFTEELLRENEKLRFRVVQLEEQVAASSRAIPTPATLKELVERIHALEQEREVILRRFADVEAENRQYEQRYHQIERENNNLASLYVAAYQLHSTFDLREVLQTIAEILLNFIGAKIFGVLLIDSESQELRAVVAEGIAKSDVSATPVGQGAIGSAVASGQARYAQRGGFVPGHGADPIVVVPLRFRDRTVGALAIWEFLQQKTELAEVDYELFNLLAVHAASALEAARLRTEAGVDVKVGFGRLQGLT